MPTPPFPEKPIEEPAQIRAPLDETKYLDKSIDQAPE